MSSSVMRPALLVLFDGGLSAGVLSDEPIGL
jgi:hypothetical protein